MALNGTINGSTSNQYIDAKIVWSATQSVSGNYSDVTATLSYSRNNTGYTTGGTWNGSITINGTKTTGSKSMNITYNSNTVAMSAKTRVYHNNDGSKSITISASGSMSGTTLSSTNVSSSVSLTTIPRSSSFGTITGNTIGSSMTVGIDRKSDAFTHQLWYKLGNSEWYDLGSGIETSKTFTINSALLNQIPNSTSGTLQLCLRTYKGTEQIGNDVYKNVTVYVGDNIKPSIPNAPTIDPEDIITTDGVSRNLLIQNNNKITVNVSDCKAGDGSSIKSYKFDVLIGSTVIATKTVTSASTTFGPFARTGTLKFRLTVTDNRGRTASNSGSEPTCTCYAYVPPSFSSFSAFRCDPNGNADDNGEYIKYSFGVEYSSVNNTNSSTVKIYYKQGTTNSWTTAANALTNSTATGDEKIIKDNSGDSIIFDTSSTYLVYATITDNYGGSVNSSTITVFGACRILNIRQNGTGVALGKMAESDNLFESKWPAKFDDNCDINGSLTVGVSTQSSTPTNGIAVHDVRNAEITPDSFGDQNVNFYFDKIGDVWQSVLHMKGWTGEYAAWELAGNANNSLNDDTLKYRQGRIDTWGDWQTILTNKNIGSYALLPSGAAMTGQLYLGANLWYQDQTSGLNCQNSDITNVNAIYFQDMSDSAGEAINFYRDGDHWDTLYAYNGALKYHPNRGTNTVLGGHTILHSNNFRTGTCTLYTSGSGTTVNFSSAMTGTPTIMLTPLTSTTGALPAKVLSRSTSGFTAIIGGDAVAAGTAITFMYLALRG